MFLSKTQGALLEKLLSEYLSDHKAIGLYLTFTNEKERGPGTWKFNNTLLTDEEYLKRFYQEFYRIKEKYRDIENAQLLWELIKIEIRSCTIKYSKQKNFGNHGPSRKIIAELKVEDDKIIVDEKKILNRIQLFQRNLFS